MPGMSSSDHAELMSARERIGTDTYLCYGLAVRDLKRSFTCGALDPTRG